MLLLIACTAQRADSSTPSVYEDDSVWLCHPEKDGDVCSEDLSSTVVEGDGTLTLEPHVPSADPAFDCFYLYPTCSLDQEGNSDWEPGAEEAFMVKNQAARLSEVCRVFAPVYRQRTIRALFDDTLDGDRDMAFGDVEEAWRFYLEHHNEGRGVVLVAHSQGAYMLKQLLADVIEPEHPELLVGAWPIGAAVEPGDFETPLCSSADEAGCALSYLSYRVEEPPDDDFIFAKVGSDVACLNPAGIGAGSVELHGYYPTEIPDGLAAFMPGGSNPWQEEGEDIETPFYTLPGLVTAECAATGETGYLAVSVHPDPEDPRADDIGGDFLPGWGLHLVDVNIAMGDLVDLAERQYAAW